MYSDPLAYFLTFRTYGTWLPGDDRGSTRRREPEHGSKMYIPSTSIVAKSKYKLKNPPVALSPRARDIVNASIERTCQKCGWTLIAVNVRSNHVHVVVHADRTPDRTMTSLKSWATNALRAAGEIDLAQQTWSRHGSTIYLFTKKQLDYARWYTLEAQEGDRFEPPAGENATIKE